MTVPTLKNQFLAGLLTLAITVLTAAVAIPESAWASPSVVIQFVGMVVATAVIIFLPLSKGGWAGALKIGGAIVAGVVANLLAFFSVGGHWGFYQWMLLGLAILNVVAGELGIQARITDAKVAVRSPEVDTATVRAIDPAAVRVAEHALAA